MFSVFGLCFFTLLVQKVSEILLPPKSLTWQIDLKLQKLGQEGIKNSATLGRVDLLNWPKIAKTDLEGIRNSASFKKPDATNWPKTAKLSLEGIRNSATFGRIDLLNWPKIAKLV